MRMEMKVEYEGRARRNRKSWRKGGEKKRRKTDERKA
jgi:hypothetical protein